MDWNNGNGNWCFQLFFFCQILENSLKKLFYC